MASRYSPCGAFAGNTIPLQNLSYNEFVCVDCIASGNGRRCFVKSLSIRLSIADGCDQWIRWWCLPVHVHFRCTEIIFGVQFWNDTIFDVFNWHYISDTSKYDH